MKKVITNSLKAIFYSCFFMNISFAQSTNADVPVAVSKVTPPVLSDVQADAGVNSGIINSSNEKRSEKLERRALKSNVKSLKASVRVLDYLQKNYDTNKNPGWKFNRQYISATMKDGDITTIVRFTHNGRWLQSIKIYKEAGMPKNIKNMITQKYPQSTIKEIQEVKERNEYVTPYYVRIEDGAEYKDLLIYGGRVDVYNVERKNALD